MITVGAFEAKTHLSTLLEKVAQGEEIVITRHGKPLAMLIPIASADRSRIDQVINQLKTLRKGCTLDGLSWQDLRDEGAWVPSLWYLEIGNVMIQAERRGRIMPAEVSIRLELMADLPIHTDQETPERALHEVLALARAENLTTYDAAYLELAIRRGLPLATKDKQLCNASVRLGVQVIPN